MKKQMIIASRILWHICATFILLTVIGAGVLAWRLSSGPINLSFALSNIEEALNAQNTDLNFDIETLSLDWGNKDNLIGLKAEKVTVSNRRGPFLYTPEVNLNLSLRHLFLGQFKIEDIWVPRISLSLTRQSDGRIQITGVGGRRNTDDDTEMETLAVVTLESLLYDLPVLNTFRIDEARVTYRDRVLGTTRIFDPVSAFIDVDISLTGKRSMSGYFTLPFDGENHSNVRLDFATKHGVPLMIDIKGQVFDTYLKNLLQFTAGLPDGWDVDMTMTAEIGLTMNNDWALTSFTFNGVADEGHLLFPVREGVQEKVSLKNIDVLMTKDETGDALQIDKLTALADDIATISVTGGILHPADMSRISGDIHVDIDRLPQSWFPRFWPKTDDDLTVREWLADRITHGEYSDLQGRVVFNMAAFDQDVHAEWDGLPAWLPTIDVKFAFENMHVDYNEPMIPAAKVKGTGHYKDVALSLNIEKADVGGLLVENGTLVFDDLVTSGKGEAVLHLPITGDIGAVFNYIAKDPINALDKIDLDIKRAKGTAKLMADVTFPMVNDMDNDDIHVEVTGVLSDVELPDVLRGLTLSDGPFNVAVTANDMKFSGSGRLQGQPIAIDWHEYFEKTDHQEYMALIDAKLTADDAIRRAFMKDKADIFTGMVGTELVYKQVKDDGRATVDLKLDMQSATIFFPDIGINKPHGQPSSATLNLNLRDGHLQSVNNLTIRGDNLSVQNGNAYFKTVQGEPVLQSLTIPNIKFGENDLSVKVGMQDDFLKIALSGAFIDARPILQSEKDTVRNKSRSKPQPYEVGIDVTEMRTSDKATIKNVKAYAKANALSQIERFELDAVAGKGALYVRYTPMADERLSLRVEADDAGATLRAFDLYPNIVGGRLRIGGMPLPGGRFGDVKGKARIDDFTVWNAPVLARLVNALSLPGILGLLEREQLGFSRLEADFEWRLDPAGDLYIVENGTTSGASLGLTFEGSVDTRINEMTIRGTAAPLSGINKMIGQIPIIGNLLTGGDNGAVVAATYTMRGPVDDPQVSVNPLSMLTPGILRRMLFENTSGQQQPTAE